MLSWAFFSIFFFLCKIRWEAGWTKWFENNSKLGSFPKNIFVIIRLLGRLCEKNNHCNALILISFSNTQANASSTILTASIGLALHAEDANTQTILTDFMKCVNRSLFIALFNNKAGKAIKFVYNYIKYGFNTKSLNSFVQTLTLNSLNLVTLKSQSTF